MEVKEMIADRLSAPGAEYPYEEKIFTEIVMEHMAEIGMTFEPEACHYERTIGNARLRLGGYSLSEDADELDLFVSLYEGMETITPISDTDTKLAAEQCLRFLKRCAEGRLASTMDQSDDAHRVVHTIHESYPSLDQIRIYVLTDRQAKAKNFQTREVSGKTVKLEVMDIERLWRHWSEGKPRDELVVNFEEVAGGALPCVYVPGETTEYDYALTAIPGEALRFVYEKYGPRLLEANVRSFLSATGKVNRGIRDTLRETPERFMAYNNGIVVVADEMHLGRTSDGSLGILWLKGMQIVNGGQTTASIYFTKKRSPEIDLSRVRVPAKIIRLRSDDRLAEEGLVSDISKYANSQNSVKLSDLSANKPYHVKIEQLSLTTYCPDGVTRWFYERASGGYSTMLAREGTTPARLKKLKNDIPSSRKITKTDLAKFLNAWDRKPHIVSFGAQKNFEQFMKRLSDEDGREMPLPDIAGYKQMIAKAIIFKSAQKLIRPMFAAFQANVTAYTVSVLSDRIENNLDLDRIWQQQGLSAKLQQQIQVWAPEVYDTLNASAAGRMISEWSKKAECWESVLTGHLSEPLTGIPETR
jgi:hypothetical protein